MSVEIMVFMVDSVFLFVIQGRCRMIVDEIDEVLGIIIRPNMRKCCNLLIEFMKVVALPKQRILSTGGLVKENAGIDSFKGYNSRKIGR